MSELDRTRRAVLAAAAFVAFACAFVTTPIVARSASGPATTGTVPASPTAVPSAFALVLPRRDPFTGDPPSRAVVQATAGAGVFPRSATGSAAIPPTPLRALPPNVGAAITNAATAGGARDVVPLSPQSLRVTAVVTGAHPWALVDDTGTTRLVTLGDRLAGDRVARIGADGIRLADGRAIPVTRRAPAVPVIQGGPPAGGAPAAPSISHPVPGAR